MRFLPFFLLATPASAHVGHIGDMAGHDHWVLGAGLGAIAGAAVLGWLKGGRDGKKEAEAETDGQAEDQPA
ncbi:DUF6732 family protein [uncultured Jannaschia sp.]|uniref:DUF6732 family protein n=1 Tax=uncultured Jannaschia sp. TaxID=293347 RepID=UPI00261EFC89|nr:DUF6732 family protein [uncultured Jannaschia sp.]